VGQSSFALPGFWGPRPTGDQDDIEEEKARDQQEVQPLLMYMALAEIPSRKRQQTSCRRARLIASNLLQALEASVVHNLA